MTPVGAYEAKTRLPALLREVENGRSFVITNRGRVVAVLGPVPTDSAGVAQAVAAMKAFSQERPIADNRAMALIEKGSQ
jgi:prevent-host-death family protein